MIPDEVLRRIIHAAGALGPVPYIVEILTWRELKLLYIIGAVLVITLETVRLHGGLDFAFIENLTRDYERTNPAGYALYVISSMAVIVTFDPQIALPAVFALALVDPISGLLAARSAPGVMKRPMVLLSTFGLATAIAAWFVPIGPAILCGVAVTIADGLTPVAGGYVIDDNLTIPPVAAIAIWIGLHLPG